MIWLIKKFLVLILVLALVSGLFLAGAFFLVLEELPGLETLKNYNPPQSTQVYDRNKILIGSFFEERRILIDIKLIPNYVKHAFIAAEDGDFYTHRGVDISGLLRAIFLEFKHKFVGGRRVGGSTITQQTARTMLLSSKQTYIRKLREIILARRIEKALTKNQILYLYLNQIYFGNGAYGIEEASRTYFGKKALDLSLSEATILASIPKSPNKINPWGDKNRLSQRQNYVLDQMVKHKFVTHAKAQVAKKTKLIFQDKKSSLEYHAPYFLSAVQKRLRENIDPNITGMKVFSTLDLAMQIKAEHALKLGLEKIDKRAGYRGPLLRPSKKENKIIYKKLAQAKTKLPKTSKNKFWDLRNKNFDNITWVKTKKNLILAGRITQIRYNKKDILVDLGTKKFTLSFKNLGWALGDKNSRKQIQKNFRVGDIILVRLINTRNPILYLEQEPILNGGLIALDVATGGVLALVGGYDYFSSSFNRITQSKRQAGSGIKPLIYALSIEEKKFQANSIITDTPKKFLNPATGEFWGPRNHTRKFLGDITFRRCLVSSVNICTVTILEKLGLQKFLDFAHMLELNTQETPYPKNLTISLGSAENYPIDLANAMRIFPNQGYFSGYHLINHINFADNSEQIISKPEPQQLLSSQTSFIMTNLLKNIISKNKRARYLNKTKSEFAGKTGTTNGPRSLWFWGYSPKVIALVYVGHDNNNILGNNEWGITTAFPIWAEFMNNLDIHQEELKFPAPEDLEWRYINQKTGLANAEPQTNNNQANSNLVHEAFLMGTAPEITPEDTKIKKSPQNKFQGGIFAP